MAVVLIAVCVIVAVTAAAGELVRATIARMLAPVGPPSLHRVPAAPRPAEPRTDAAA